MKSKVFLIDPQSVWNMSFYDIGLVSKMKADNVTFFGSCAWNQEILPNGIRMNLWFKYGGKKNKLAKLLSYIKTLLCICILVVKQKPQIVHIQWIKFIPVDSIFAKFLQFRGIKVIYTAHNLLPHNSGNTQKEEYHSYYQTVDKIILHAGRTQREFNELFPDCYDKTVVIPHGIMYDMPIPHIEERIKELSSLHKLDGKVVFSSLGNLSTYKGIDLIVNVWAQTDELRNGKNCHLIIAGRNNNIDLSPLEGVGNATVVNGIISDIDFQTILKLSSITLLPYRKISQSGVLFSAIGSHTPILVSDVGGLPEPLTFGNIGVNIGEPKLENLKEAMCKIARHPENIQKIKENNTEFEKVKEHYSWESISRKTLDLYSLISN